MTTQGYIWIYNISIYIYGYLWIYIYCSIPICLLYIPCLVSAFNYWVSHHFKLEMNEINPEMLPKFLEFQETLGNKRTGLTHTNKY